LPIWIYEIVWATDRSIDYHPLVNPITDLEISNFNLPPPFLSTRPSVSVHPTINTGPEPHKAEPFPTALIAAVSVAVFTLAAAGLLVYHKKHKHSIVPINSGSTALGTGKLSIYINLNLHNYH
jgi:hypothetical protein